jgi:hypothetical protein
MSRATIAVRAWAGLAGYRPPRAPASRPERLTERQALIMYALSLPGVEELGVAAYLVVVGQVVLDAGIVVPDDLPAPDYQRLQRWAAKHPVELVGSRLVPPRVLRRSDFLAPRAKSDDLGPFLRVAYWGRAFLVGFNLGRTCGLLADRSAPATGRRWGDGWLLHFDAWERQVLGKDGQLRWCLRSHRPSLRVAALGVRGGKVEFGPAPMYRGKRTGEWADGRPYRGKFIDLLAAAFSLDGVDDDDMDCHLGLWGVDGPAGGPHFSASPDPEGAALALGIVQALHQLALRLDEEVAAWGLDLPSLVSPGTAGSQLLCRLGAEAPLAHHDIEGRAREALLRLGWRQGARADEAESWATSLLGERVNYRLDRWMAAMHGGWVWADRKWLQRWFEAIDLDLRSAYAAVAVLLLWWDHLTAKNLRCEDATAELAELCSLPRADLAQALKDPATWRRFGLTRCIVEAKGEPFPVHFDAYERLAVVPAFGRLDGTWLDAAVASLTAGRPVEIIEASRLVPEGRLPLRKVRTLAGVLGGNEDPVLGLYQLRQKAKQDGDFRLAGWLRVLLNSLVYGNFGRFDVRPGREVPGPWAWPPLAACVAAGSRALLMLLRHDVEALGGRLVYVDTDGAIVTGLAEGALGEVLSTYDQLCPWGGQFWSVEAEGEVYIFGPKRYTWAEGPHTEHAFAGVVSPPSTLPRDLRSGHHPWFGEAARSLASWDGPLSGSLLGPLPWEASASDFPRLQRFEISTPAAARDLPATWRVRPFARVVRAFSTRREALPIALDHGRDLADWRALNWWDVHPAEPVPVHVLTEADGYVGPREVVVEDLRGALINWGDPEREEPPAEVTIDPRLVRLKGRDGAAFYATDDTVVYRDIDRARLVGDVARRLGPSKFAELTDGVPLDGAKHLSIRRRKASHRTLWHLREALGPDPVARLLDLAEGHEGRTCARPGCTKLARPRSLSCSEACRRALARARMRDKEVQER